MSKRVRRSATGAGLATVIVLAAVVAAYAAPGALDSTFGGDGRVTTDLTNHGDFAGAIAIQTDGKIVVAGGAAFDSRNPRFGLARYNMDGTLDSSFGGDGRVTTDFTRREDAAYGVLIQPDGKVVAAGDAGYGTGNSRFAVARYNTDGTLDPTFSGDGRVMTQFTRHDDPVAGLAIQADGKIVVSGGVAFDGHNPNFALARYNTDGTLDTAFGGDGKVVTDFGRNDDYSLAVVVQADGSLVAGGFSAASRSSGRARLALARYHDDGSLDTAFGGDGKVITDFTRWDDSVQNLALQPDGKIVAVGTAGFGSANSKFALARYNTDGTLDVSLGGDGKVAIDITPGYDSGRDVALQPDGKIVEGGYGSGHGGRLAVARFNADGSPDVAFGSDGKAMTNFTSKSDFALGLARQTDGNLVLAGGSGWGGSNPKVALARFLGT
jgi:uncharacterized delta-60 repeat protein